MATDIVPIFGILIGWGMPVAAVIVWIVLNYRKRRRLMELHHAERMAAIERGMDVPPLPLELLGGSARRRRTSLLPGLVWLFVGLAITGGMLLANADDDLPWMIGLIPLGIGAAYLIYYFAEGKKIEARLLEHDLNHRGGEGRTLNHSGASSL